MITRRRTLRRFALTTTTECTRKKNSPAISRQRCSASSRAHGKTRFANSTRRRYSTPHAPRRPAWQYFNHARLFELAKSFKIKLDTLDAFASALANGVIRPNGLPAPRSPPAHRAYMYDGGDGTALYMYVRDVFHAILEQLTVLNISDYLDRGLLLPLVKSADFILVQGAHQFSPKNRKARGTDQPAQGRRRANHVDVQYAFNLFEATSSSAYNLWLRGVIRPRVLCGSER